jgi:hypothetical protein
MTKGINEMDQQRFSLLIALNGLFHGYKIARNVTDCARRNMFRFPPVGITAFSGKKDPKVSENCSIQKIVVAIPIIQQFHPVTPSKAHIGILSSVVIVQRDQHSRTHCSNSFVQERSINMRVEG